MINRYVLSGLAFAGLLQPAFAYDVKARLDLEPLIVKHAAVNNVPAALVHRIIIRESRYNPRAVGRGGAMGLMQIKHGTARALGYAGPPAGLLDADTNLTYAVRYLAGAYRVANGDQNRAVGFYARGYYYDAKRRGMLGLLAKGRAVAVEEPAVVAVAAPQPTQAPSIFSLVFAAPRPAAPAPEAAQAVVEESEAPAPARRRSRSAKRGATSAASPTTTVAVRPGAGVATVQAAEVETNVPLPPKRRDRPAQPRASVGAPVQASATAARPVSAQAGVQPAGEGGETQTPVKRGGRSARPTAASGADRSAQRVSERPGGPGKSP
jgi:hypothetical protein